MKLTPIDDPFAGQDQGAAPAAGPRMTPIADPFASAPLGDPSQNALADELMAGPEGQKLKAQLADKAQKTLLQREGREGALNAGADAFLNSLGLNVPRNITAGVRSLREGVPFESAYNVERDISEAARAQNPGTALAAELAGGLVQGALLPEIGAAKTLGQGAGLLEKAGNLGRSVLSNPVGGAAVQGGVGAGLAELADSKDIGKAEGAALLGAGLGAGASKLLARPAAAIGQKIENMGKGLKIPSQDELRESAESLYRAADNAGFMVKPGAMQGLAQELEHTMAQRGVSPSQFSPNIKNVMRQIYAQASPDMGGGPPTMTTLRGLDLIRQDLGKLTQSNEPKDRELGRLLKDQFDGWLAFLPEEQFASAGDPQAARMMLESARGNWHKMRKSEAITDALRDAGVDAETARSGDFDSNVRKAFGRLYKEARKANKQGWTQDELEAMQSVWRRGIGIGPIRVDPLRIAGGLTPDNPWKLLTEFAPGAIALAAGSPHAIPALAAGAGLAIGGGAAKKLSERGTRKAAESVDELIRAGGTNDLAGRVSRADVQDASKKIVGAVGGPRSQEAIEPEITGKVEMMKPPKVGVIEDGHRFLGGNPADPKAWQKVEDASPENIKVGDVYKGHRYNGGPKHEPSSWERAQ